MASKELATTVHVGGVAYGPDDKVPADVAKQITNPKAWASSSDDGDVDPNATPADEAQAAAVAEADAAADPKAAKK